jgi:hypothetical protein
MMSRWQFEMGLRTLLSLDMQELVDAAPSSIATMRRGMRSKLTRCAGFSQLMTPPRMRFGQRSGGTDPSLLEPNPYPPK